MYRKFHAGTIDPEPSILFEILVGQWLTAPMDLLRQAFRGSDSAVEMMVTENIGSKPEALPLLLEASQDREESVREAAQLWLDLQANQP